MAATVSNFWRCLEDVIGIVAVPSAWHARLGAEYNAIETAFLRPVARMAPSVPCPRECGCAHKVIKHKDGRLVAVCQCEPWNCEDLILNATDVVQLELNLPKLNRAIAAACECQARHADLGLPGTHQVGAWSSDAVPVILTIQQEPESFRHVVAELVARLRKRFILLAPTKRFVDSSCLELLENAKAELFDLESQILIESNGSLTARQSPGKLFQQFAPEAKESLQEDDARKLFALVKALDSAGNSARTAPVFTVFRLYCMESLSAEQVASKCHCSKGTVMNRLKVIRRTTGTAPAKLRAYSTQFDVIAASLTDKRARKIHRKSAIDEESEDD